VFLPPAQQQKYREIYLQAAIRGQEEQNQHIEMQKHNLAHNFITQESNSQSMGQVPFTQLVAHL